MVKKEQTKEQILNHRIFEMLNNAYGLRRDVGAITLETPDDRPFSIVGVPGSRVEVAVITNLFDVVLEALKPVLSNISPETCHNLLKEWLLDFFDDVIPQKDKATDTNSASSWQKFAENSNTIRQRIEGLLETLRAAIETWTAFTPIVGFSLSIQELNVGTITFYPPDKGGLQSTLARHGVFHPGDRTFQEGFNNSPCYAVVNVVADENYVSELALQKVEEAIHIINLFKSVDLGGDLVGYPRINVVGRSSFSRPTFVLYEVFGSNEPHQVGSHWRSSGGRRLDIDAETLARWKGMGFDAVCDCFSIDATGTASTKVRSAILWHSKSVNAETPEERFISLTVAIETLLGTKNPEKLQPLSDRMGFLLGGSYAHRERSIQKTSDFYTLRNAIVHEGKFVEQAQCNELDVLACLAILAFVKAESGST